ncbi:guided entry of tail-anchored proteins factor 1-like [Tubulanus polymorphus]|uniref:guided entry of tail-anchored proteins factor 1-like n=1 Tax=Tubulanus polymorphus TaxID=672921 RepID=UPI003DA5B902
MDDAANDEPAAAAVLLESQPALGFSAALFVFVVVFVFTMFPHISPYLAKIITVKIVKEEKEEIDLKSEISTLRKQLRTIHMVDEFSKYAKTERKIIKFTEQLKVHETNRSEFLTKVKIFMTVAFQIIRVICMGLLLWWWKSYPVLVFSDNYFSPVSSLVSFPSQVTGGIGLIPWLLICGVIVNKISSTLTTSKH